MTVPSGIVEAQLKLVKKVLAEKNIEECRKGTEMLGKIGIEALGKKVSFEDEPLMRGFTAAWALPENRKTDYVIIYLHGGSYTSGGTLYSKSMGGMTALALSRPALCVNYRLAPEFAAPAQLEDALFAYDIAAAKYPESRIAIVGESAGGGLSLATAQALVKAGKPIYRLGLLSPWLDLTFSGVSHITNANTEIALDSVALHKSAKEFAGSLTPDDPTVSPIFGKMEGLPPTFVCAGTAEILESDTLMLISALRKSGVPCKSVLAEGMWHVYALYPIAEAEKTMNEMKQFFESDAE